MLYIRYRPTGFVLIISIIYSTAFESSASHCTEALSWFWSSLYGRGLLMDHVCLWRGSAWRLQYFTAIKDDCDFIRDWDHPKTFSTRSRDFRYITIVRQLVESKTSKLLFTPQVTLPLISHIRLEASSQVEAFNAKTFGRWIAYPLYFTRTTPFNNLGLYTPLLGGHFILKIQTYT